jgi:hypothetical protein
MNRCLAGDDIMVYKYIDIVGTSNTDMSAAVDNARLIYFAAFEWFQRIPLTGDNNSLQLSEL